MASTISAFSNRDVREANARAVLARLWSTEAQTGSDLILGTGLTRATVHDVCQELLDRGWIEELPNQRDHGGYVKGRPARRYAFDPRAGVVVGVGTGEHHVTATVADLRGRVISHRAGELTRAVDEATDVAQRLEAVSGTVLDALTAAEVSPNAVLAVGVGVPAPVGTDGRTTIRSNPWWNWVNPDIGAHLQATHGWAVLVDNDANLAALAERWVGSAQDTQHVVTLLAGQRLGAGVIEGGRLLRGSSGRGGEMNWLDYVDGVGSTDGIAQLGRRWALEGLSDSDGGHQSSLQNLPTEEITTEKVFSAAEEGDPLARAVIRQLGERLARVAVVIAKVFDTDLIIIAGSAASSIEPILDIVRHELRAMVDAPAPQIVASRLGSGIVSTGAIRLAIDYVQEHALDIALANHGHD